MEYVDGTLDPSRAFHIELMVKQLPQLQNEIAMLKAMGETVKGIQHPVPMNFTRRIMDEILPHKESLWFRFIKNSSNVFAMVIVLSLIGTVLISSTSSTHSTSDYFITLINSFSPTYNEVYAQLSSSIQQFAQPVNSAVKTPSGKILMVGLIIFSLYVIIDEVISKRMMMRK